MSRKYLPKALRESILNRFGGKCGYCGEMPGKLQIDHVMSVARGRWIREFDVNNAENLMPACPSCNNYKMSYDLEGFRREIAEQVRRARQYSVNFRLAERFGLVEVREKPIVFYFERERT